jgi:hypothetical protein
MIFMQRLRALAKWLLVILSCATAFLPYLIPYDMQYAEVSSGRYVPNKLMDILPPIIWLGVVVLTLAVGRWDRKLFWLFALFPIAFGYWLFYLYLALSVWLFGFAP